jgi:hypothetical protein
MRRLLLVVVTLALMSPLTNHAARANGAGLLGPGRGLTANDIGGIIQAIEGVPPSEYRELAANWCARWGRLSYVTSMHLHYGDYVSFVCMDRPNMIH